MNRAQCELTLIDFLRESVKSDYILLDLPYFPNVGDVLIWQSTMDILREIPYKCLYSSSIETYRKPKINKNVVILFMGGGNFGDLWIRHQHFRHRVLDDFPKNPIIQLPQSICFNDHQFLQEDIKRFYDHEGKITICTRDEKSFQFVNTNYPIVDSVLLPDMVLALDVHKYIKPIEGKGTLFVKRNDSESAKNPEERIVPQDADIRDWPTMEKLLLSHRIIAHRIIPKTIILDEKFGTHITNVVRDVYFKLYFRKRIIKSGLRFINQYKTVYTTRLHVGIVAALLGKPTIMYDNSYGKIRGVYDKWMNDWNGLSIK